MRNTINRPNYLNKDRIIWINNIKQTNVKRVKKTKIVYLTVPHFYYCPVMGLIYSSKTIILEYVT